MGRDFVPISGFAAGKEGIKEVNFSVRRISDARTAWDLESDWIAPDIVNTVGMQSQGADLMPRTAVCIEILDDDGSEQRVNTPAQGSAWGFTVKKAKVMKDCRFPGRVAGRFVYRMIQSENLAPFMLDRRFAPIAIPAVRDGSGKWSVIEPAAIRRMGFIRTARRFEEINERLLQAGQGKSLQRRIDERNKLTRQVLGNKGYLVVSGAGGKHVCAACFPLGEDSDVVVDQTLYWEIVAEADEAWYRVGMLNSHAMTRAISPFNPKGDFGERHIHKLPYRLVPRYDRTDERHARVSELAKQVGDVVLNIVSVYPYLADPCRALHTRRSDLKARLDKESTFQELETFCKSVLNPMTAS